MFKNTNLRNWYDVSKVLKISLSLSIPAEPDHQTFPLEDSANPFRMTLIKLHAHYLKVHTASL